MRYWITRDNDKGIIFISLSKFTRIEGELKMRINDSIKLTWPEAVSWPRKFVKKFRIDPENIISGEIQIPDETSNHLNNPVMKEALQKAINHK